MGTKNIHGNIIKFTPFSELNSSTQFLIEDLMDKAITDPDEAVRLLSTDYIDLIDQGIAPKYRDMDIPSTHQNT